MGDQIETELEQPETPDNLVPRSSHSGWKGQIVIVGIAALLVGLVLGYLGRGTFGPEAMAANSTATADAGAVQTRAAQNQEVMTMLVNETRHFKGEANAPVTLIEFSDFQ